MISTIFVLLQAKVLKLTVLSKIKLTVDIQAGKLLAVKPTKDVLNDKNVFSHDRSTLSCNHL